MATTTNFGWETPDDTDLVKDGALAMRTLGNAIDTSLVDLKGGTTGQNLRKNSNTDMDFVWAGDATNTVIDAEGDLLVGDSADTLQRLAIGSNGNVLTVDTSVDGKLKWAAAASSGALTLISTTSFSAVSSVSLASSTFSSTYSNYKIIFQLSSASTTLNVSARMRVSGADNTAASYSQMSNGFTDTNVASNKAEANQTSWSLQSSFTSGVYALDFDLLNPFETKPTLFGGFLICDDAVTYVGRNIRAIHGGSTSFDAMSFIASTGNFTGSVSVYGYSK